MANTDFSALEMHVRNYVVSRVPNPFFDEGLAFKPVSNKLMLATAIFDGKIYAELSAIGKNLAFLTAGGIANYYLLNPLLNTFTQIELAGFGNIPQQSRRLELNLKIHYFVGPKIFVSDGRIETTGDRLLYPPTVNLGDKPFGKQW